MDIILIVIAALFMLLGILGSFLPVLPGPITSWVGLLIIHFTDAIPMNTTFLVVTFIIAACIWVLDYIIPAIGTKRFGGSKYGMIGTTLGLIIGLLSPIPGGIIIGPFVGALIGELINKNDSKVAIKAAFGSFIGFITSTFLKFIVAIVFLGLYFGKLSEYSNTLFNI
ncbi:DUF456 domain-containing protein [Hyunsoonleella pacifica]|uniref:DUF456 domain-containing protein n=1 Tax=Hyunsoonleella pacifica TaxID=1080224 RepID=A0A4Q9FQV8_9FLAO|nr:DUF456 domain-containing protein [Hyunsoonleella pacifica]TBN15649.1 DUF456 domain-containing protein [Hyunsoonleella pacifica]GGD21543.1 membrane protein [Hyunsoonleella pacifica]